MGAADYGRCNLRLLIADVATRVVTSDGGLRMLQTRNLRLLIADVAES